MQSIVLLTSILEEKWEKPHAPSDFHVGRKNRYSLNRSCADPRASLDVLKKRDISCRCCVTYREGTRGARCNGQTYKREILTCNRPQKPREGIEVQLYPFFKLGARCMWVVNATPLPIYLWEWPDTQCTGGWLGRSGEVRKISPQPEFNPRTGQQYWVAIPTELSRPTID